MVNRFKVHVEEPENSKEGVDILLDKSFSYEPIDGVIDKVVILLDIFFGMILMETEEDGGGISAIKSLIEEYKLWKGPMPKDEFSTRQEFANYVFSPKIAKTSLHSTSTTEDLNVGPFDQPSLTVNPTAQKTLKVKIYTGIDFPNLDGLSPPNLIVKLSIKGLPNDLDKSKRMTKVHKNALIPEWAEEFEFRLHSPKDQSLLLEVYDHHKFSRNAFAGMVSLPIFEVTPGRCALPLYNKDGNLCDNARLVVRFMIV